MTLFLLQSFSSVAMGGTLFGCSVFISIEWTGLIFKDADNKS